jgi:hypothetical protein
MFSRVFSCQQLKGTEYSFNIFIFNINLHFLIDGINSITVEGMEIQF